MEMVGVDCCRCLLFSVSRWTKNVRASILSRQFQSFAQVAHNDLRFKGVHIREVAFQFLPSLAIKSKKGCKFKLLVYYRRQIFLSPRWPRLQPWLLFCEPHAFAWFSLSITRSRSPRMNSAHAVFMMVVTGHFATLAKSHRSRLRLRGINRFSVVRGSSTLAFISAFLL